MSSSTAFSAYPPHRHRHTTHILPSTAVSLLSAYLVASTQDASLHPNALLSESGPKAAASTSSSKSRGAGAGSRGGLVLHNLRRVEAGLRGEYLGAGAEVGFRRGLLEGENEGGEDDERRLSTSLRNGGVREANTAAAASTRGGLEEGEGEFEWQDREEFEREQVVVGGGALGEKEMEVERRDREVDEVEVPRVKETKSSGDKEERKRRKKEKRKKEKKEAEIKRQQRGGVKD